MVSGVTLDVIMQNLMERLRPLVGSKGWDYCVLWKLSEDQRLKKLCSRNKVVI